MSALVPGQWYALACRECSLENSFPYRAGYCYVRCPRCGGHTDVRDVGAPVAPADVQAHEARVSLGAAEVIVADPAVKITACPDALTQLEAAMEMLDAEEAAKKAQQRSGAHVGTAVARAMEQWGCIRDIGDGVISAILGPPDFVIGNGVRVYLDRRIPFRSVLLLPPTASFMFVPPILVAVLLTLLRGWMYSGICDPSVAPVATRDAAEWCAWRFWWLYVTSGVALLFSFAVAFTDPGYIMPDLNARPPERQGPRSDHPMEMVRMAKEDDAASPIEYQIVNGVEVERRWCRVCGILRPMRAAHCYVCGLCVGHSDHHCSVIGADVGERNVRYFFTFLMLLTLSCANAYTLMLNYFFNVSNGGFFNGVVCVVTFLLLTLTTFSIVALDIALGVLIVSNLTSRDRLNRVYNARDKPNPFDRGVVCNFWHFLIDPTPPAAFSDSTVVREWYLKSVRNRQLQVV